MEEKEKNTPAENKFNERKKAMKSELRFMIIVAIVLAVSAILIGGVMVNFGFGILSALGLECVLGYFSIRRLMGVKRSFCKECGTKYNYERDISWEIESEEEKENKVVDNIEVECTCPKCGATNNFTVTQTVAKLDTKTGQLKKFNISNLMRNYFYKPGK